MNLTWLRDFPAILRRPASSSTFLPVIDGLRFIAILPVVIQHLSERAIRIAEARYLATPLDYTLINALPSGRMGVELFFVISGLIISYPFVRAHFRQTGMPNLKAFYLRRLTRLEPPYFIVMAGCYLFVKLTGYVPEGTRAFSTSDISIERSLVISLGYVHGLLVGTMPKLNPPAWSLEIEIQFYTIAPVLLLALFKLRGRVAILFGMVLLALSAISVSSIIGCRFGSWNEFFVTRFLHFFASGMLVNVISFSGLVPKKISPSFWDILFITSAGVLCLIDGTRYSLMNAGLHSICYIVLFLSALNGNIFNRFLSRPWIVAVGGMCYTIYLLHLPILHVLTGFVMRSSGLVGFVPGMIVSIVIVLPILFLSSVLFYLLIERPCMNPKWPANLWRWSNRYIGPSGTP